MANIPKAKRESFATKVCAYLEEMGCTQVPNKRYSFYKETKYGEFGISVWKDKSCLYSIVCMFSNPALMPKGLGANYYSGKYNLHQWDQDVDLAVDNVKNHLQEILN